jgi:hypothetical protein
MADKGEMQHIPPCNLAVETKTRVDGLEESDAKQWKAIGAITDKLTRGFADLNEKFIQGMKEMQEKYANRLPVWATFLIAALFSVATGFIVAHFAKK